MKKTNEKRTLDVIAQDIYKSWKNLSPHAQPYLVTMLHMKSITDQYGDDSARSIVLYFLSNASSWRGEDARKLKSELKDLLKPAKKVCCRCGTTENLEYGPEPYNSDINNDQTPVWECKKCRWNSAMDI